MGRTLLDKIWDAHTVRTEEGGRTVLYIDRQYIHEVTSPVAFAGLARRGVGVVHPDRITATSTTTFPPWTSTSPSPSLSRGIRSRRCAPTAPATASSTSAWAIRGRGSYTSSAPNWGSRSRA